MEKAPKTRIYEVPSEPNGDGKYTKISLVDAISLYAARQHVANKHVGEASLPNGRRIADLMGAGIKVEAAKP